jgi:hypothetical protein
LLREDGQEVEMPFLELDEELWDPTGTRLTVFFDPGRIKRGLKPREEEGPALEDGKSYTLVIDQGWPDAAGRPLTKEFRKQFKVAAPDDVQPRTEDWKLTAPAAGSSDPLVIAFNEPLDWAMLRRVLVVEDPDKQPLEGRIEIDQNETRWQLHPLKPWAAGEYALKVDTALEDLGGNSLGRPFEVDIVRPTEQKITSSTASLPFRIGEPAQEQGVEAGTPYKSMIERLRGKVVWMAEALKRKYGVAVDADVEQALVALETADGELFPIVKDARGRAFHKDERLRGLEMELEVRRHAGSPMVQVVRTFTLHEGQAYLLDYWCDICSIPMFELKECECCPGPIRIRERKVDPKSGEVTDEERSGTEEDSTTETRRHGEEKKD